MIHEPGNFSDRDRQVNEIITTYLEAVDAGQMPDRQEWLRRYPEFAAELEAFLADYERVDRMAEPLRPAAGVPGTPAAPEGVSSVETPTLDSAKTPSLPAGTTVRYFGDYELLEEIGRGGMGVVYKTRQVSLNRVVALKMILAGQLASPADVQRFHTEAQTAANLQHPNIVAIHEVGQHEGQHYFSMDYVEGSSLAQLTRQQPLPPKRAARYIGIMADAIHYAHQQGTLHRDLKPSNVLIDGFDQPRITDFGLARRIEAQGGLTATGELLGTPSYMSPEQAAGDHTRVGPASDVYSLGATLYELVTARPPFRAATPLDTLLQVREEEPAAPRLLNSQIDRDLETIILKCLAKDPARRYPTARALAEDLRAYADGRPIKARRPGLAERGVRWLRKQRRSVILSAPTAAVCVLLLVGLFFGWKWYSQWRLGTVLLSTAGAPLEAEVLDEKDQPVIPPFPVGATKQPVTLPGGLYRLRLTASGQPSQDYEFLVEQGIERSFEVGAPLREEKPFRVGSNPYTEIAVPRSDGQLWDPLDVSMGFEVANLDGRLDVLLLTDKPAGTENLMEFADGRWIERREKTVVRISGTTGKQLWQCSLRPGDQPALAALKREWRSLWRDKWPAAPNFCLAGELRVHPWFVLPAAYPDGKGARDLFSANQLLLYPHLLAVSGKDGAIRWVFDGWSPQAKKPADGDIWNYEAPIKSLVCPPIAEDVDGDGKPDLVVVLGENTCASRIPVGTTPVGSVPEWIEALSGTTGQSLWRYSIPPEADRPKPVKTSEGDSWADWRKVYAATVYRAGGKRILIVAAGSRLVGVDLKTGQEAWPVRDLGFRPLPTPVFADLTGDGQPAALLLRLDLRENQRANMQLVAFSPARGALWQHEVAWTTRGFGRGGDASGSRLHAQQFGWPVVGDLDGDGRAEVIVPYDNAPDWRPAGWVGLEVLDGVTGQSRWRQRLSRADGGSNEEQGVAHFIAGPDLDGDGHREVFTAALIAPCTFDPEGTPSKGSWLLVAASSGADGQTLWRTWRRLEDVDRHPFSSLRLQWCPVGADGWPRLMVSLVAYQTDSRSNTDGYSYGGQTWSNRFSVRAHNLVFSITDGKFRQTLPDLYEVNTADFNGDGLPETYGLRLDETGLAGKLHVLRGDPPEQWRRLGTWVPEGSGQQGRTVYCSLPLPEGDLDGDGTADVLVFHPMHWSDPDKPPPLAAYSGKDGHRLWKVSPESLGVRDQSRLPSYCHFLQCRDLDGDGRPEVIFVYRLGEEQGSGSQGWLAVLSGRNGSVLWKQQLGGFEIRHGGATTETAMNLQQPVFADLNGDGLPDVLVTVQTEVKQQELRALDGRKGWAIWKAALPVDTQAVALACLRTQANADGPADVVVTSRFEREEEIRPDGTRVPLPEADWAALPPTEPRHTVRVERVRVSLLGGADGQEKWTWSGAEGTEFTCAQPVLADLDGDGRPAVCVAVREKGSETTQIVVLDLQGQPRHTLRVHPQKDAPFRVWSHDLDGNSREELLLVGDGKVQAIGGNFDKPLWQWPFPGDHGQIVAIRPAGDGHRAVVVVLAGKDVYSSDKHLYGLDGANGKPLWQRAVPRDVEGAFRGVIAWQPGTQGVFAWGGPLGFRDAEGDSPISGTMQSMVARKLGQSPGSAGEPAGDQRPSAPTLVVMNAPGIVYGLDSRTGQTLWRCSGPGRAIGLSPDDNPGDLPSVWYHTFKPEGTTICRVALPVDSNGKYIQPPATPVAFGPPPVDNWVVRPLPWENQARKRLSYALLPGLACLVLVGYCAARRKWWAAIGLVACLVVVPLLVGWAELKSDYLSPEQHHARESWYLIWPHALSTPQDMEVASCFWLLGLAAVIAFLCFLPRKWRVPAVMVLVLVLMLCGVVTVLSSHGPVEGKSFWAENWRIPGGLTLKSPLVWMVCWLLFLSARRIRRRRKQPLEPQADAAPGVPVQDAHHHWGPGVGKTTLVRSILEVFRRRN